MSEMFKMMIFAFVGLCLADMICGTEVEVRQLEIGTSGTLLCDHEQNDPLVRLVQWYKSRRIDVFENNDPSLASWGERATESQSNYHIENTTFSLVIEKATLEDEGLYKCFVERGDLFTESSYYTPLVMYALPRKDPNITLDTDLNRVLCTVEHVKPLIHPMFDSGCIPYSTETSVVLNGDGTYTTSVSCALPQTKSESRVDCSFSYLHYQQKTSLRVNPTNSQMENRTTTTVSPMATSVTCAGDGSRAADRKITDLKIAVGFLTVGFVLMLIIIIIMWIKSRKICHWPVQICSKTKKSDKNIVEPALEMEIQVAP